MIYVGVVKGEARGGRPKELKLADECMRATIKVHINRFPRMESHYCRSTSSFEYLSSDLNISIMYYLFKKEHPDGASQNTYYQFSSQ